MDCSHDGAIGLGPGFDAFVCFCIHGFKQGFFPQEVVEAAAYVFLGHDAPTVAEVLYQYKR